MEKVLAPKNPKNWDDLNSQWVSFHNGKEYLLPIVRRHQTYEPVFEPDGSVSVNVKHNDPELADLVDRFLILVGTVDAEHVVTATLKAYGEFIVLVRKLLAYNYAFTDEELRALFTTTEKQFNYLFGTILSHIRRA